MTNENKKIGEVIFHEKLDELVAFFKETGKSKYDYIVMNNDRVDVLNKLFNGSKGVANNNVITRDGLLFVAEDIASYYKKHNFFPSILIVSDVLFHGRSVYELIDRLKTLIFYYLSAQNLDMEGKYNILRKLTNSLDIHVYTMDKKPPLMDDITLEKLRIDYKRYTKDIRKFVMDVYYYLRRTNGSTLTSVLSYEIDSINKKKQSWMQKSWKYYALECDVFLKPNMNNFVPIISNYRNTFTTKYENVTNNRFTSRVLFGELDNNAFNTICLKLADILNSNFLSKVLREENPLMQYERLQVIEFLLSLIYLIDFLPEKFDLAKSNIDEVASHFGKVDEFIGDVKVLLGNEKVLKSLKIVLDKFLNECSKPLFQDGILNGGNARVEEINEAISLASWNLQMNSEISAERLIRTNRPIITEKVLNRVSIGSFKKMCETNCNAEIKNIDFLCALIAFENYGIIKFDVSEELAYVDVIVNKLAMTLVPKINRKLIPAFILAEEDAWKINCTPAEAVKSFYKYILEHSDDISKEELDSFKLLKTKWLDILYEAGQTLKGWDFNLIMTDELVSLTDFNKYYAYALNEIDISEKHLTLARKFLNH